MTEIQKYLAEEVAEDLADGIITRREAMRRLGLLGVSGAGGVGAAGGVRESRRRLRRTASGSAPAQHRDARGRRSPASRSRSPARAAR